MIHTDICIAGAGIIGLSLALELHARGLSVAVVEAGLPLREASVAAAGMLAANDPHNPSELAALSRLSVALYPEFLDRLRTPGGGVVPFQTSRTLQLIDTAFQLPFDPEFLCSSDEIDPPSSTGFYLLRENSLDPRQLAAAVLVAVGSTSINLITDTPVTNTHSAERTVIVKTARDTIEAAQFIDCTGAWANDPGYKVVPIKGQMLAVALSTDFTMRVTLRTKNLYIVPRTVGPNAGRAIIGATIEDTGFDKAVHALQIEDLRQQAIALIPQLAIATVIDSWSGLRPATLDRLPLIGPHPTKPRHWAATGHYRNGILLAPATARIMTQLILGEAPAVSADAFHPSRLLVNAR